MANASMQDSEGKVGNEAQSVAAPADDNQIGGHAVGDKDSMAVDREEVECDEEVDEDEDEDDDDEDSDEDEEEVLENPSVNIRVRLDQR